MLVRIHLGLSQSSAEQPSHLFRSPFLQLRKMCCCTGHKMPAIMTMNREKCCFLRQILSDSFYSAFVQSKMPCPLSPRLKLLRKTDISLTTLAAGGEIFLLFPSEGQSSHNAEHLEHAHTRAHTRGAKLSLQQSSAEILFQTGALFACISEGFGQKKMSVSCPQW